MFLKHDLRDALDAAEIPYDEAEGGAIEVRFRHDPLVSSVLTRVDADAGRLAAEMTSTPLLRNDEGSQARGWFVHHGLRRALQPEIVRHRGGGKAVRLRDHSAPPTGAAGVAWLRQFFDEGCDLLRSFDRSLLFRSPEMHELFKASRMRLDGRRPEAIRLAERSLRRLRNKPRVPARAIGMHRLLLGEMLFMNGNYEEAQPHVDAGVAALAETDAALVSHTCMVLVQHDLGRRRPDLVRCDQGIAAAERVGTQNDIGRARALRCQILLALGRSDTMVEGREGLVRLESQMIRPGWHAPGRLLADVRLLAAIAFSHTDEATALEYLDKAEAVYGAEGVLDGVTRCRRMRETGFLETSADDLFAQEMRSGWDALIDDVAGHGTGAAPTAAAPVPWSEQDPAAAEAALIGMAEEMRDSIADFGSGDVEGIVERWERMIAGVGPNVPATEAAESALAMLREALPLLTVGVRSGTSGPAALRALERMHHCNLANLRYFDEPAAFASVADRERWNANLASALTLGFMTSSWLGRHRLAHLLLSQALRQGRPDVEATLARQARNAAMEENDSELGLDWDARDDRASEGRVANAVRDGLVDVAVARLRPEDTVLDRRAVAGPGAWQWTLWRTSDQVFWSVVRDDGAVATGFCLVDARYAPERALPLDIPGELRVTLDGRLGRALAELEHAQGGATPDAGGLGGIDGDDLVDRLLVTDVEDREPTVAWDIGQRLIPYALRAELIDRTNDPEADPLPLVITASPSLVDLPYALLAVGPPTPARPLGTRLVEGAVVTIAAPATVAHEVAQRPASPPPLPLRIAVVDPTDDLPHSAAVLHGNKEMLGQGTRLFDGNAVRRERVRADAPTWFALTTALVDVAPGAPGVLLLAGHVDVGSAHRPLDGGLRLPRSGPGATEEVLRLSDLILGGRPGASPPRRTLGSPSRAVVFGCASLGAGRPSASRAFVETTEWWGLPVALLLAGARSVLATCWATLDCPAAAEFAAELVVLAREAPDMATALRKLQLHWLREWAEARAGDRSFDGRRGQRHPHLWAAWAVVGVHGG